MFRKTFLITGGLGLIGSSLISHLNKIDLNYRIICVDTFSKDIKWKYLQGMIVDELISYEEFCEDKENFISLSNQIFHLGACSSTTEDNWKYLYNRNYRNTIDIIEAFLKCKNYSSNKDKKLIIASSASTYGNGGKGFVDDVENIEQLKPLNPYGMSKHLVDIYLKRNGYFKDILSLKFFNIFGVNEFHKENMRSIAHWGVESIIKNQSIRLFKSENLKYEDGRQLRDFLDVDAAVEIMIYLGNNSTGIYNVGCGESITWNEMANTIISSLKKFGNQSKLEYIDMPKYLKNKYQYYTQADMSKSFLKIPNNIIPNKAKVLKVLENYTKPIFERYSSHII